MEEINGSNIWPKLAEKFAVTDVGFWRGAIASQCLALGIPRDAIELAIPDCLVNVSRFLNETLTNYQFNPQGPIDEDQGEAEELDD